MLDGLVPDVEWPPSNLDAEQRLSLGSCTFVYECSDNLYSGCSTTVWWWDRYVIEFPTSYSGGL